MFKIIDRTLMALKVEQHDFSQKKLYKLCELLVKLGVDYIELSLPVLKQMGQLPPGGHYILRVESQEQYMKCLDMHIDIDMYTMDLIYSLGNNIHDLKNNILYEIKIENVFNLYKLKCLPNIKNIRITGLDDMICTEINEKEYKMLEQIKKKVDFCPRDNYYCATALAIEWLINRGKSISASFNGVGGYAKLEEVLLGIKVIMHKNKIKQELSILTQISTVYQELTGKRIYYNKAVVGKNIFNLESGIQVCSDTKKAITYEPYDPAIVGRIRRVVIGKNSSDSALILKLKEKGITVPDGKVKYLLDCVRQNSMRIGRSLTDQEFLLLVQGVLQNEA